MKPGQRTKLTGGLSILDEPLKHIMHSGVDLLYLSAVCEATLSALNMLNECRDEREA
jgi:hypothetical protein